MIASPWLDYNAGAVQAVAAVVLIIVTTVYVILTRSLLTSSRDVVKKTQEQIGVDRELLNATRNANALTAAAYRQAALNAAIDRTPTVTVELSGRQLLIAGTSQSVGTIREVDFPAQSYDILVGVAIHNQGPGPAYVSFETSLGNFLLGTTDDHLEIPEKQTAHVEWLYRANGGEILAEVEPRCLPQIIVHSRAVTDTDIADRHVWTGRLVILRHEDRILGAESKTEGNRWASRERTLPDIRLPDQ